MSEARRTAKMPDGPIDDASNVVSIKGAAKPGEGKLIETDAVYVR